MKIELNLPQFNNKKALLVVTGEHDAKIYVASNGIIKELDLIYIQKPQYTDREGFFEEKNSTGLYGSGSVYEPKKLYMRKKFLKSLKKELNEIFKKNVVDDIHLFSPRYMEELIKEELSNEVREKVESEEFGNYFHMHPFKLLLMIKKKKEGFLGERSPMKGEARKLLKKNSE